MNLEDETRAWVQEQVQRQLRRLTVPHPDPLTGAVLLMSGLTAEELEEAGGMPQGDKLELQVRMTPANRERSRLLALDAIDEALAQDDEDAVCASSADQQPCCTRQVGGMTVQAMHGADPACRRRL